MALLINLSDTLENRVQAEAKKRRRTPEQIVVEIVEAALETDVTPSVAQVVARIKATAPNPALVTLPQGSLAEALRDAPTDPDFDLETWENQWSAAEAELKRINLMNDIAEGQA